MKKDIEYLLNDLKNRKTKSENWKKWFQNVMNNQDTKIKPGLDLISFLEWLDTDEEFQKFYSQYKDKLGTLGGDIGTTDFLIQYMTFQEIHDLLYRYFKIDEKYEISKWEGWGFSEEEFYKWNYGKFEFSLEDALLYKNFDINAEDANKLRNEHIYVSEIKEWVGAGLNKVNLIIKLKKKGTTPSMYMTEKNIDIESQYKFSPNDSLDKKIKIWKDVKKKLSELQEKAEDSYYEFERGKIPESQYLKIKKERDRMEELERDILANIQNTPIRPSDLTKEETEKLNKVFELYKEREKHLYERTKKYEYEKDMIPKLQKFSVDKEIKKFWENLEKGGVDLAMLDFRKDISDANLFGDGDFGDLYYGDLQPVISKIIGVRGGSTPEYETWYIDI